MPAPRRGLTRRGFSPVSAPPSGGHTNQKEWSGMADIGLKLERSWLYLTTGREFNCSLQLTMPDSNLPTDWPSGSLYFEFDDGVPTQWPLTIAGPYATLLVDSTAADLIPRQTKWQLIFVATGDTSGGVPVGRGITVVQS